MADTPTSVSKELRARLWTRVGPATRSTADQLVAALDELESDPAARAGLDVALRCAHSIAGIAGVYGFPHIARAASRVEELLRAAGDAHAHDVPQLRTLALEIRGALGEATA